MRRFEWARKTSRQENGGGRRRSAGQEPLDILPNFLLDSLNRLGRIDSLDPIRCRSGQGFVTVGHAFEKGVVCLLYSITNLGLVSLAGCTSLLTDPFRNQQEKSQIGVR